LLSAEDKNSIVFWILFSHFIEYFVETLIRYCRISSLQDVFAAWYWCEESVESCDRHLWIGAEGVKHDPQVPPRPVRHLAVVRGGQEGVARLEKVGDCPAHGATPGGGR
jgi:hypothetical protein